MNFLIFLQRLSLSVVALCLLTSCIQAPVENSKDNNASLNTKDVTTVTTNSAEKENLDECILSIEGMITGVANFQDKSIDGSFATFIYDGGAIQALKIQNGKFTAPILARRCASGLDPIGFQLTIGEWRQYIKLKGTALDLVIQLPSAPEKVENIPEHEVVLGKISGLIRKDDQPVPDNTEVKVYVGGGLQQTVFTRDGVYVAAILGDISDKKESYLPTTIKVESEEISVTPSSPNTVQDINLLGE